MQDQPPPYAPPGQAPQYPHPGPTVITTGPTVLQPGPIIVARVANVDSNPTLMVCPACSNQIVTRVELVPSIRTHVIAAILCLFIFWPCACLPYCIGSCNNADHYCPHCNAYVGSYRF